MYSNFQRYNCVLKHIPIAVGGSSANFRLTQQRSDAIKKYLLDKGVPASNILYSVGYGEQKILNNCHNGAFCLEMLHKQNQRSLIVVLNDNVMFE